MQTNKSYSQTLWRSSKWKKRSKIFFPSCLPFFLLFSLFVSFLSHIPKLCDEVVKIFFFFSLPSVSVPFFFIKSPFWFCLWSKIFFQTFFLFLFFSFSFPFLTFSILFSFSFSFVQRPHFIFNCFFFLAWSLPCFFFSYNF